ncbi:MAG: aminotransferase class IV [Opitutus sp.]
MSHFIQACTNGRLHDAKDASISPLNRGFLYGDAIYEVWRTYHGALFAWHEHWERLQRSAAALAIELPLTSAEALAEIKRSVAAYRSADPRKTELYIRLQVTRGGGPIGLDTGLADKSDYLLLVQPNVLYAEAKFRAGLTLSLATTLRRNPIDSLNPAWKTGNYLNNILCLREARSRGADEVVITNLAGEITEAAVSNIGFVQQNVVVTPPLQSGLLAGITRDLIIRTIAVDAGFEVREATVRPENLDEMEECFLLSTTKDVTPVAAIDAHLFKVGDGTATSRLKVAFTRYTHAYVKAHPELRAA